MSKGSGLGEAYRKAGPYLGLGLEFAATVILCFVGGHWLDGKMGTEPLLALTGLLVGTGAATFHLLRVVNRLSDRARDEAQPESDKAADL
jgi:F0F1-type ATP synthase assembly protein I